MTQTLSRHAGIIRSLKKQNYQFDTMDLFNNKATFWVGERSYALRIRETEDTVEVIDDSLVPGHEFRVSPEWFNAIMANLAEMPIQQPKISFASI